MLRTRVVTHADAFGELREPWRDLFHDAPTASPFQSYAWQTTWWRHFGARMHPHLLTVHEGKDLIGLFPLFRRRGVWRRLRPIGVGASDYLHPLARDGREEAVARAIGDHLAEVRHIDLVDLHQVRETRALAKTAPGLAIDQAVCLLLDLPKTYDAYLATLSKSLRYDVRRLDRAAFAEGKATIDPVGPDDVRQGMQILFDQHRKRWRSRRQLGAFALGGLQRFHLDWAEQAAQEGLLWLSVLRHEGEPIGAIYAMATRHTCYYYQAGFDPDHGAISPGTLLVAGTIRRAIEEGRTAFDFMRGDEPYKRRWKPQHALTNRRYVYAAPGIRGGMGAAWNLAGSRVEDRVRARLEGKGLI